MAEAVLPDLQTTDIKVRPPKDGIPEIERPEGGGRDPGGVDHSSIICSLSYSGEPSSFL